MKIALLGKGKMGERIAALAFERGDVVVARFGNEEIAPGALAEADVCIDFSHPSAVLRHVKAAVAAEKPLVIGTTGWERAHEEVEALVNQGGIGCIASANFSMGFHLFLAIVRAAARTMNAFPHYDVSGWESHHREKGDSPSGTAKRLATALLEELDAKSAVVYDRPEERLSADALHFASLRCGSIPGSHTILFDSPIDTLTLNHQARSRDGFADGALRAAHWIVGKKGFYSMEDMMRSEEKAGV